MENKFAETLTKSSKNDREIASGETGFSNSINSPFFLTI
jgi:hypothetical protein